MEALGQLCDITLDTTDRMQDHKTHGSFCCCAEADKCVGSQLATDVLPPL